MKSHKFATFPKNSSYISTLIIRVVVKLKTRVIILVNTELPQIAYMI